MACLIHINGLIDVVNADKLPLNEKDIYNLFTDVICTTFKSKRSTTIKNTWYLWIDNIGDEIQNNYIGTAMVGRPIYSTLVVLHDSELHPNMNMSEPISISYDDFTESLYLHIKDIKSDIYKEEQENPTNIVLIGIGVDDNKVMKFLYDMNEQTDELYDNEYEIEGFFEDCIDHLFYSVENNIILPNSNVTNIYKDNNYCVVIYTNQLLDFIDDILQYYIDIENYEFCSEINKLNDILKNLLKETKD